MQKRHIQVLVEWEKKFWKLKNVKTIFPDAFPEKCKNVLKERRTIRCKGF